MMEGFEHAEKCHFFRKMSEIHDVGSGMAEDDKTVHNS